MRLMSLRLLAPAGLLALGMAIGGTPAAAQERTPPIDPGIGSGNRNPGTFPGSPPPLLPGA